jgi:hypothetical protein
MLGQGAEQLGIGLSFSYLPRASVTSLRTPRAANAQTSAAAMPMANKLQ